jgi:hypothetical protein
MVALAPLKKPWIDDQRFEGGSAVFTFEVIQPH